MAVSHTHKNKTTTTERHVVERSRDNAVRLTTKDGDVVLRHMQTPPDLFLKASPVADAFTPVLDAPASPAEGPKVIGSVSATALKYDVTLAGRDSIEGCGDAFHLTLVPRFSPSANNMRALWVDPATFRICRAEGIFTGYMIVERFPILVRFDVGADGFATHYTTTATGRIALARYTLTEDGTFLHVRAVPPVDDALFRR